MTSPAWIASGSVAQEASPATPLVPGLPAGLAEGNILLCLIELRGTTPADYTLPGGWSEIANAVQGGNYRFVIIGKIAGASESAPSISWVGGGTDFGAAKISSFTNPGGWTVIADAYEALTSFNTGGDVSVELPTVTAGGTDRTAVVCVSGRAVSAMPGSPSTPGGDYVIKAGNYYSAANLGQGLYTGDLSGGGSISGEAVSFPPTPAAWFSVGFALVGTIAGEIIEAVGTSAGVAIVTGVGASTVKAKGTVTAGTAGTTAVGRSTAAAAGTATGSSTAQAVSISGAIAMAAGIATVLGIILTTGEPWSDDTHWSDATGWVGGSTVGTSAGLATVAGVGAAIHKAQAVSDGLATVNGVGFAMVEIQAVATADGAATVSGVAAGPGAVTAVATSAGKASALGVPGGLVASQGASRQVKIGLGLGL